MIPDAWQAVVLALAVYRLCRLAGWDTFPLVARVRSWVIGAEYTTEGSPNARMGVTGETVMQRVRYRRPFLAELVGCAFCLSFWLGILTYLAWRWEPSATLAVSFPLALSAAAGLIAKRLDP